MLTRENLLPWQRDGVDFMKSPLPVSKQPAKMNGDEPGLGKTPQTCVALAELKVKSLLLVCPDPETVKTQWIDHLVDWGVCQRHEIYVVRTKKDQIPVDVKFIIVGYSMVIVPAIYRQLYFMRYDAFVADEAQRLRGLSSLRSNRVLGYPQPLIERCFYKFFLTGSFVMNRPADTFPILRTVAEEVITPYLTYEEFGNQYCGGYQTEDGIFRGSSNEKELAKRLEAFMIRRRMVDVFDYVPEVIETDLFIDIGDLPSGGDTSNTMRATLRKEIAVATVPYTIEYLEYALDATPKILVFTFHRDVSEMLKAHFGERAALYYGGLSQKAKDQALTDFKTTDLPILIAQLNAAGEALDGLQRVCNTIVYAEPDWVGGTFEQNVGRLKRYLQDKPISVTCLIPRNGNIPLLSEIIVRARRRRQKVMHELLNNQRTTQLKQKERSMIENQLEKLIELNTEIARQLLVIANTVQEAVDFPSGADGADSAQQPAGKRTRRGGSKNAAAADTAGAAAATAGQTVNADPNAQPAQQPTASQAPAAPPVESSPATVVGTGGPTVEDVRKAASAYSLVLEKSGMADEPRKALIASVLKPLGANALAELNPAMFGAAIALFQSAAATAAPAPQPVAAGNGLGI